MTKRAVRVSVQVSNTASHPRNLPDTTYGLADGFSVSQLYAIIVLPNGGPDLETFVFAQNRKNGWAQACSLFWQVVRSLAEAEDMVHFEVRHSSLAPFFFFAYGKHLQHRDLHWGQILVQTVDDPELPRIARGRKVSMDHKVHGVRATVIDLGLSRMETGEAGGLHFTIPDKEIFEGEGTPFPLVVPMKIIK
jgi:serine/threonine-protein kinase haspin